MFGESGIRLASIIIGIVVIIGLIIVANRYGSQIRQRLPGTKVVTSNISPSPEVSLVPTSAPETYGQIVDQTKGGITYTPPSVSQIPSTGAETIVIPALISLFGLGLKLRKIS